MKRKRISQDFGNIVFGKSRPAPKAIDIDVELDEKALAELPKIGLELIKKDKQALINYAIVKALENIAGVQ